MRLYRFSTIPCLLSLLLAATLANAELYRYRGPEGRLIISNSPPPAGVETTDIVPEGAGPSTHTTVPSAVIPARPKAKPVTPKSRKRRQARREKARQESQPVNTHKFGLLPIGSSQAEVKRRIGPPEKREKHGKQKRMVDVGGRFIHRRVRVESWYYPGSGRLLPTHLVFYDGKLAEKNKGRP
ncbi:MAG: DUF4124 domain-containing protein [Candidatus Tectomicrobia bacterium]|nr:DUF4124 domain-containing protein [Candidatus Tectomicrobia bacterium]